MPEGRKESSKLPLFENVKEYGIYYWSVLRQPLPSVSALNIFFERGKKALQVFY
jgi:hypothetical protein